jgi:hypothetical protein
MHDPVAIANFRTKLEAEMAAGLLDNAGIPCLIQSTEGGTLRTDEPGSHHFGGRDRGFPCPGRFGQATGRIAAGGRGVIERRTFAAIGAGLALVGVAGGA